MTKYSKLWEMSEAKVEKYVKEKSQTKKKIKTKKVKRQDSQIINGVKDERSNGEIW